MKTALLLSFVTLSFAFVGCSKSSKSESCEYNGQKVDCSQMPSSASSSSASRSASDNKTSSEIRIEVTGKARYEIKDGKLTFLDEIKKVERRNIAGGYRGCQINVEKGLTFEADANERELILEDESGKAFYERTQNSNVNEENLFIGQFLRELEIDHNGLSGKLHSFFTIGEKEIEIHNICNFDY